MRKAARTRARNGALPGYLVLASLGMLLLSPMALRAQSISSLRQHDVSAPIDIDAQRIELRDRDKQAIFNGAVKVRQGNMALDANQIRVFYEGSAGGNLAILRLDADGDVRMSSPSEQAQARYGVYDVTERLLTLIGSVVLRKGDSVVRGDRLQLNLVSGLTTLDGASSSSSSSNQGRVTGRFVVPDRQGNAAPKTP